MYQKIEQEIMQNWKGNIGSPVVSICCTTYNHENYIVEAIEGFLMQATDFPFEILVRDDCSTDKTAAIIKEYAHKYPNLIKPVLEKENTYSKGVKPMPKLFKIAKGKYIALCEGDDYWTDPKKLQIQVDEIQKYNVGMSFHANSKLYSTGQIEKAILKKDEKVYSITEIITGDFHLVQTNTILFKRKYLEGLNLDLLANSPVGDVWIRIAVSIPNGALYINRDMAVYRIQAEGSWSSSMQEDTNFLEFIHKMMQSIDDFDEYWEYTYTKEFSSYKNMYIRVVMTKNISKEQKNNFMEEHRDIMSFKNKILWNFLYKNQSIVYFLKKIKCFIKRIK